jgi:hypothetical protein
MVVVYFRGSADELIRLTDLALQRLMQPRAYVLGQLYRLRIAEYFYGRFRLDHKNRALWAIFEMLLQLLLQRGVQIAVDVVRDLEKGAPAVQFGFLSCM